MLCGLRERAVAPADTVVTAPVARAPAAAHGAGVMAQVTHLRVTPRNCRVSAWSTGGSVCEHVLPAASAFFRSLCGTLLRFALRSSLARRPAAAAPPAAAAACAGLLLGGPALAQAPDAAAAGAAAGTATGAVADEGSA